VKNEAEFSTVRLFLWPIHGRELKKFIPMIVLFFLISFNYHLLRIVKDVLIITAPKSGAEVIPFLKVWLILPSAVLMTIFFTRLSNVFNREKVFYVMVGIFLVFFALFITVLYPMRERLFLNATADALQKILPAGAAGFVAIVRYWMYAIFYVFAELWSTIMVSLLLWGFANDVTSVKEAKRFYALFGIGINFAGVVAGKVGAYLAASLSSVSSWDQTFSIFVMMIIACGIVSIVIHRWLHIRIFSERRFAKAANSSSTKKTKLSLLDSLSYIAKSNYLICIVVIVLSYNIVINLTEVVWKSQMKEMFPNPGEYATYMSNVTFYAGIMATLGSYFISGNIIRKCGWKFAALIPPAIIVVTGVFAFYFLFMKNSSNGMAVTMTIMGMTPLALAVFFLSMQNCFSRAAKYTLFDDTKEMAFIPLSSEGRLKGKSAIDGIGSRLGKSGSSLVLQIMLMTLGSPAACSPYIAVIILLVVPVWVGAVRILGNKFEAATSEKTNADDIAEKKSCCA